MPFDGNPDKIETIINDLVLDALYEARALIEQGWCKNTLHKKAPYDRYCIVGAIEAVEPICAVKAQVRKELVSHLDDAVLRWFPIKVAALIHWNDHKDRIKSDVLNLFDKAIEHRRKV